MEDYEDGDRRDVYSIEKDTVVSVMADVTLICNI
jgi:hypothetical protein